MAKPLTENAARDAVCAAAERYGESWAIAASTGREHEEAVAAEGRAKWRAFLDALDEYASVVQAEAFEQAKRAVGSLP